MHGKKTNDSLEKKKRTHLDWVAKQLSFSHFRCFFFALLKPKKKPCSITPQEWVKQYPGKFHADNNLLSELKIMAGQPTMSGQYDYLSAQNLGLAVILTGHVCSFQITN